MNRLFGLNFQGIDDTIDGTGLDSDKISLFFKRCNWNRTLTIGVCMYSGIDAKAYLPVCQLIKSYGHKVFIRPVDSADVKDYSVKEYADRYQTTLTILGKNVDLVECANEVNGDWLGLGASEKMTRALSVALQNGKPRVVTLSLDNSDPNQMYDWSKKFPFRSEYVLISDYPNTTLGVAPIGLNSAVSQLAYRYPGAGIGVGEYGSQDANGSTSNDLDMVSLFETRIMSNPQDIGGGFWWDAYQYLVKEPNDPIFQKYAEVWK